MNGRQWAAGDYSQRSSSWVVVWSSGEIETREKHKLAESNMLSSEWMQALHAEPGLNVRACVHNEIMVNFNMDCSMPAYCNTDDAS